LDISFKSNANIDKTRFMNVKMNLNNALNSSIDNLSDNLIMWTENAKQILLKGMETCPVCYYYIHQSDRSLPLASCRTCKKKFHSLCLTDWIKSSGKNNCPMCRQDLGTRR
jgi:hypothetical protein